MVRSIVLLTVVCLFGCSDGDTVDRSPLDEEYCGNTGLSYIVTTSYPHPWNSPDLFGDTWALFTREVAGRELDASTDVLPLMVHREEGSFDLGDRVCVKSESSSCDGCYVDWDDNYYSFTQSSVQSSDGSITCTLGYPRHVLEDAEFEGYESIDGAVLEILTFDRFTVDEEGNQHEIYTGWWDMEYYEEAFQQPVLTGTGLDDEGQEVNLYEYTFSIPQTLLDIRLCDDRLCSEDKFFIGVWVDKDYWLIGEYVDCVKTD